MDIHFICADCGQEFSYQSERVYPRKKLCPDCQHHRSVASSQKYRDSGRAKYMYDHHYKQNICIDCGTKILNWSTRCRSCSAKQRGELSRGWKGGRIVDKAGYVSIVKIGHPRTRSNGYVFEHIVVWEEANGKPLPQGWHIHHLNGIKSDNRSQNLVGLPSKKHYLVLQVKAKRIQELEALLNGQHQLL